MKQLAIALFLFQFSLSFGQTFTYPTIKNDRKTISDFVPNGWTVRDSAYGDLNNDKKSDLVVVLQHKDSITLLKRFENYTDTIVTQPRILVILFGEKSGKIFKLVEQNNSFVLNHDNSDMEDPYQSIKIEKGILQIDFRLFHTIGSWFVTNTSYKFRYQDQNFVLIGAENASFHRATHDFEDYSYNFLTKKWSVTKGNDNSKQKPVTKWHSLYLKALKTLKTFSQPYTWEVTKDIYL